MIDTYIPLLIMFVIVAGFAATMLILSIVIGPRRYSEVKDDPFECGTIGTGSVGGRMSVKFYLVAMIFILFDIEIIFLYPWAVQVLQAGWSSFWVMMSFLTVLVIGLAYVWRRGVLDWS